VRFFKQTNACEKCLANFLLLHATNGCGKMARWQLKRSTTPGTRTYRAALINERQRTTQFTVLSAAGAVRRLTQ